MLRVRELEAWSRPGNVLPQEYGKDLSAELCALGIPQEVFLGLSAIPSSADIHNLRLELETGKLTIENFASFCAANSLVPKVDEAESASKFLEYSQGRPLAWIHLPEDSDPELLRRIVDMMHSRGHLVIDPATSNEVKLDTETSRTREIAALLDKARPLAIEYYRLTGKPLGITGEIGEFEAARLLKLTLAVAREAGFDALDASGRRLQIKARAIPVAKKFAGRVGKIDLKKPWDAVLLIVMDEMLTPVAIYEAERDAICAALEAPGSVARNVRGSLAVTKFMSIGSRIWPKRIEL